MHLVQRMMLVIHLGSTRHSHASPRSWLHALEIASMEGRRSPTNAKIADMYDFKEQHMRHDTAQPPRHDQSFKVA